MATLRALAYHAGWMIPTGPVLQWRSVVAACALTWCATLGVADARPAQFPLPVFEVERISLEGWWGPATSPSAATVLTLGYKATIYEFRLIRLRVLNGNSLYSRILADAQPYRPNFVLRGPEVEMRKLASIRPGERVVIIGSLHTGGHSVLVSSIQVEPSAPAPSAR